MKSFLKYATLLLCFVPLAAQAEVREMSQGDLRRAVAAREAIATSRLIEGVENFTGGTVVEIRAFDADDTVVYRIIVRQEDGRIGAMMVDAQTGVAIADDTALGGLVSTLASSTTSPGKGVGNRPPQSQTRGNSANAGNNGNGGNSGGNGNSGSNGNSGGNGKGRN